MNKEARITLRLTQDLLDAIDSWVEDHRKHADPEMTRASAIRRALLRCYWSKNPAWLDDDE